MELHSPPSVAIAADQKHIHHSSDNKTRHRSQRVQVIVLRPSKSWRGAALQFGRFLCGTSRDPPAAPMTQLMAISPSQVDLLGADDIEAAASEVSVHYNARGFAWSGVRGGAYLGTRGRTCLQRMPQPSCQDFINFFFYSPIANVFGPGI
jgi:hypothetical protein